MGPSDEASAPRCGIPAPLPVVPSAEMTRVNLLAERLGSRGEAFLRVLEAVRN